MTDLLLLDADRAILGSTPDSLLVQGVAFTAERDGTPHTIALTDGETLTDLVEVGPTVYLVKGDTFVFGLDVQP